MSFGSAVSTALDEWFDPGGDPTAIRRAASACRTLSGEQRAMVSALDATSAALERSWKGLSDAQDKSASAAFQTAWVRYRQAIQQYAELLDQAADKLDTVADAVESAMVQSRRLKEVLVASAVVGIGLTVLTMGIGDAVDAAVLAGAEAAAATAVADLGAALVTVTTFLGSFISAAMPIAGLFVMGAAFTFVPEFLVKLKGRENPFDPDNYSTDDLINIFLSGLVTMAMYTPALPDAAGAARPLGKFLSSNKVVGAALYNAAGAAVFGIPYQFLILGNPVTDKAAWGKIGESSAISAVFGAAFGGASKLPGPVGRFLGGGDPAAEAAPGASPADLNPVAKALQGLSAKTTITKQDFIINGISVPASMFKYQYLVSVPPATAQSPSAPASPVAAPVPHVPSPQAAGLPAGSSALTVKPGDDLWQIAGGNPDVVQQIADLNHLSNPADIQPGATLIIPPAS
jgi:WXG100 family type VII secretion target